MTTTGDLFVNIKGNNRGLKNSLNQSSSAIKNFSNETQRQMNGIGFKDLLGLSAVNALTNNLGAVIKGTGKFKEGGGFKAIGEALDLRTTLGRSLDTSRKIGRLERARERRIKRAGGTPSLDFLRTPAGKDFIKRIDNGTTAQIAQLRLNRRNMLKGKVGQLGLPTIAKASMVGAAAAGAAIAIANSAKWSKRINEASMQYSGAAIANQNRIDAANMRKDIQLARSKSGSAIFRQNAADYRRNSGEGLGQLGNAALGAFDYGMGAASNNISWILTGGPIGSLVRALTTEGGPK